MKNDGGFEQMVGKRVDLYGVDSNVFCVAYRGTRRAFEAVEDESDGYRSMLEELREVPLKGHVFPRQPVARVEVSKAEGSFDGFVFTEAKTGHVWLRVGTDNADDYYPCFMVEWAPPGAASTAT